MPEGPEIRRAADKLAAVLVGRRLEEVWFAFEHLAPYGPQLRGERVERLDTVGKAMLFALEGGLSIYTHNLLWGRWMVVRRGTVPATRRQLRLALHTADHSALLYSASEIDVLSPEQVAEHRFLQKVGPEVLLPTLTAEAFTARLQEKRFRGRTLATVLLDQGCLSGVGNYLRCEALFLARLHPSTKAIDCSQEQLRVLGGALLEVTRRGYEQAGCTVAPEHQALAGQASLSPGSMGEYETPSKTPRRRRRRLRHYIFRRGDQPCIFCTQSIVGSRFQGRPLFWCPGCQPPARW